MAKIEVSDEFAQLWNEQGKLDNEIHDREITMAVGLHREVPPDRSAAAILAFTSLRTFSENLIARHDEDQRKQAEARKAAENAEKERLAHKDEVRDVVGYYRPIEGTRVFLFPTPPDATQIIKNTLRGVRRNGSIFRVLGVDEGNGYIRVQYVPAEGALSSDLDLIGIISGIRNREAVQEHEVVQRRLRETSGLEERLRVEAEEERWKEYAQ